MKSNRVQEELVKIANKHGVDVKVVKDMVDNEFDELVKFLKVPIDLEAPRKIMMTGFGAVLLMDGTRKKLHKKEFNRKEDGESI